MAKVTMPLYSAEARGSVGPYTYTTLQGVSVVRSRPRPKTQYSPRQVAIRSHTRLATQRWQSLTQSQRDAWNVYANNHLCPDWTGIQKRLSGYNWFVRINCLAQDAGLSIFDNPPSELIESVAPSFTLHYVGGNVLATALDNGSYLTQSGIVDYWSSEPLPPSVNPSRRDAKHRAYVVGDAAATIISASVGQVVHVWARYISPSDGSIHPWARSSILCEIPLGSFRILVRGNYPPKVPIKGALVQLGYWSGYTNIQGICVITDIPAGSYALQVTASNHLPFIDDDVEIYAGQETDYGTAFLSMEL
jgi:hypothetical protein